jgi:hypothetical protein
MKIRPVGAELLYTDGRMDGQTDRQTDRQTDGRRNRHNEANSRFSRFCERVYKWDIFYAEYEYAFFRKSYIFVS